MRQAAKVDATQDTMPTEEGWYWFEGSHLLAGTYYDMEPGCYRIVLDEHGDGTKMLDHDCYTYYTADHLKGVWTRVAAVYGVAE